MGTRRVSHGNQQRSVFIFSRRCLLCTIFGVLLLLISIVIYRTAVVKNIPLRIITRSEELTITKMSSLRFYQVDYTTTAALQHKSMSPDIHKLIDTIARKDTITSFTENHEFTENNRSLISVAHKLGMVGPRNNASGCNYTQRSPKPLPVVIKLPFHKAVDKTHRHVLPRAAYFDKRKRGRYTNATVILVHVNKTVIERNLIISCVVDGQLAKSLKVQTMKLNRWIHINHPECTHDNVIVFCYDTPARNNSRVALVYKSPDNHSEHFEIQSEHRMYIPYSVIKTATTSPRPLTSVMVCTTVYNSPPYFLEWLRYQKTLNVNIVYINAQESFAQSRVFNDTFFQRSLRSGFVQIKVWKEYLNESEVYYHSQALYYQHCLYQFQGVYEYAIMSDTDDFLIPRGANLTSISLHQYLHYLFNKLKPNLGSVRLRRIRYYEPVCGMKLTGNLSASQDGNLTQYMNMSSALLERNFKSVHKISATVELKVHEVAELMPGFSWCIVPDCLLYMAHIKRHKIKGKQNISCNLVKAV